MGVTLWRNWEQSRLEVSAARRPRPMCFRAVMTTIKQDPKVIFDEAVEHTRGLSPATFDQWFGGVQYDDLTDGVLSLRVQNEFVLEWVKLNFLPTLTDKIRELTGW